MQSFYSYPVMLRFVSDVVQRNVGKMRYVNGRVPLPIDDHLFDGTIVSEDNPVVKTGCYARDVESWLRYGTQLMTINVGLLFKTLSMLRYFPLSQMLILESEKFEETPWTELEKVRILTRLRACARSLNFYVR